MTPLSCMQSQAAEFLLMKVNFEKSWAPTQGLNPGSSALLKGPYFVWSLSIARSKK